MAEHDIRYLTSVWSYIGTLNVKLPGGGPLCVSLRRGSQWLEVGPSKKEKELQTPLVSSFFRHRTEQNNPCSPKT